MKNKTSIVVWSSNPLMFNLFIEIYKKNMMDYVDKLYIYRDTSYYNEIDHNILRFFEEKLNGISYELIPLTPENNKTDEMLFYRNKCLYDVSKKCKTDVITYMHDDYFVLNSNVFKSHIDSVYNGENDIVFSAFSTGCQEATDLIKRYEDVVLQHNTLKTRFMRHCDTLYGLCTYFTIKTKILNDNSLIHDFKVFNRGDVINDIFDDPYIVKSDGSLFEPFVFMQLQLYKKGYRKIYPFSTEDFTQILKLSDIDKFDQFREVGFVHQGGSRQSNVFLNYNKKHDETTFGENTYNKDFVERLFTLLLAPVIFFNFDEYPYLKEFYISVYIPKIKNSFVDICQVGRHNMSINKNFILEYGKNMGVEYFVKNLDII